MSSVSCSLGIKLKTIMYEEQILEKYRYNREEIAVINHCHSCDILQQVILPVLSANILYPGKYITKSITVKLIKLRIIKDRKKLLKMELHET